MLVLAVRCRPRQRLAIIENQNDRPRQRLAIIENQNDHRMMVQRRTIISRRPNDHRMLQTPTDHRITQQLCQSYGNRQYQCAIGFAE